MKHPQAVFVQLSTRCNARCVNCPYPFTYGRRDRHESMSDEVWNAIICDLADGQYAGQIGMYLHFEPLLEPKLFERIRDVNERTSAFVVVSTNGSLLTDDAISRLVAAKPRLVHVNINSGDKRQYEEMTGLQFGRTIDRARRFIERASGEVTVEINCPVMEGTDTESLRALFSDVTVNTEFWANSRGGLVAQLNYETPTVHRSRFHLAHSCVQPLVNLNILHDGSYVLCCMDWAHESKADLPNVLENPPLATYNSDYFVEILREFDRGDYSAYGMCQACSKEMGFGPATIPDKRTDSEAGGAGPSGTTCGEGTPTGEATC
jgi:pyruvate-formate lyase-activating enzyme